MDPFLPAWRLAELTRSGELGCLELLDFMLDRVERLDGPINAVVVRDFERARARARALDNGTREGALFGVPMTVKESYDLRGHPTTWGFSHLRDHRATQDALAVRRLEAAGAVVFGKTNVPVALSDWQSFNPIYGATSNPWDLSRTPGGSSGGAAAAVASGFSALEMGSDIGGSIRVPAHFCGVFGHKPSWGLVSPRGHTTTGAAAMTDISAIGPLARSARDLGVALSIVAGPDPDETAMRYALPPPRTLDAASLRVAVWSHQPGQGTSAETVALIEQAGRYLSGLGATVDDAARPAIDPIEAYHLYLMLLDAALSSRLPPAAIAARRDRLAALAADDMSADAVMLRATGIEHGAWLALNERRARIRLAWSAFFREWDVLLCPVVATPAYQHQHEGNMLSMRPLMVDGQAMGYAEQLFWPGITGGFHLPATVAPLGLSAEGLPIGVQIAGPLFGDLTTLAVAEMLERGFRAFEAPPAGRGFAPASH
jgi:amidase